MASKRGLQVRPPVGSRVRFTGYFLKSTGQQTGDEGGKRFTVVADCGYGAHCACHRDSGDQVAVDEQIEDQSLWYSDVVSSRPDGLLMRHIALGNLELVGAPPKAADQSDAMGPIKLPLGHPDDPKVRR
jgi:hypothetical protein